MKKISNLVLRAHILPADIVNKKAQKEILGGYGQVYCNYTCVCYYMGYFMGTVYAEPTADCRYLCEKAYGPTTDVACTY